MKTKILTTRLSDDQIAIFYLGQEGFIIKHRNIYILLDGYLSDYADRHCTGTQLPWKRKYESPIAADELDFIDYVFCSHLHCDHADPETLKTLACVNHKARYIVPAPIAEEIHELGIRRDDIVPARDLCRLSLGSISVLPIASAHEELHTDKNGDCCELGYKLFLGNCTVYHSGDCCIYDSLTDKIGAVDVAMLPVNGRDYYRRNRYDIIGNMNSDEALILAREIKASLLIPMHFDLYDCNGIRASEFVSCHERTRSTVPFHIFRPGERLIYMN